jgi:hypothetical protein
MSGLKNHTFTRSWTLQVGQNPCSLWKPSLGDRIYEVLNQKNANFTKITDVHCGK